MNLPHRAALPTWRQLHPGEDPRVETIVVERMRAARPWEKMRMLLALNASARRLTLMGLRRRHPAATPEELQRKLATLLLGAELSERAFGPERR